MYSAFEALVGLAVVEQVTDAVHGVLEDRGGGEHDHADRGIDERDDVEGGHETGDLADEAEVFECFHGDRGAVSTVPSQSPHHGNQRQDAHREADQRRCEATVLFDLLLIGRDDAQHRGESTMRPDSWRLFHLLFDSGNGCLDVFENGRVASHDGFHFLKVLLIPHVVLAHR